MAISFGSGNSAGGGNIVINIEANDNASNAINSVGDAINNFNIRVNASMRDAGSGTGNTFRNISRNLEGFGADLAMLGRTLGRFNDGIISTVQSAGSAIASFCSDAISNYRELSRAQGELAGVVGNDTDNPNVAPTIMSNASASAKRGALWSEQEYIQTSTELYKTGIGGITENSDTMDFLMKFKTANGLTDEEVGQTMAVLQQRANANGENIGSLPVMTRYLNQIQKSADASPADVSDIIKGMSYGDPLARTMSLDFASEMALLAGFSSGGYTGTQGGTMLRRTLQNVPISGLKLGQMSKTKKAGLEDAGLLDYWGSFTEELSQYNSTNDADWAKRFGLLDKYVTGDAYKQLYGSDMSENQKMGFAYSLLGTQGEALPSMLTSMNFGAGTVQEYRDAGNGTGVIDKYEAKAGEFDGTVTKLENSFNALGNQIGEGFSPVLSELANQLLNFINGGEIDTDKLRSTFNTALDEVGEVLSQFLGEDTVEQLKGLGRKLFDLGINLAQVSWEALPQVISNMGETIDELAQGNFFEAIRKGMKIFSDIDFSGIEDEDVRNLGNKLSNLISMLFQIGNIGDGLTVGAGLIFGISALVRFFSGIAGLGNLLGGAGSAGAGGAGSGLLGAGAVGMAGATGLGLGAGAVAYGITGAMTEIINSYLPEDEKMGGNAWEGYSQSKKAKEMGLDEIIPDGSGYNKGLDWKKNKNQREANERQEMRDTQPQRALETAKNKQALIPTNFDWVTPVIRQNSGGTQQNPSNPSPVQNTVNTNTNLQNNTQVSNTVNVSAPFQVSLTEHINVTQSTTKTKIISGNRSSTNNTNTAVNSANRTTGQQAMH